jgi:transposase
MALADSAGLPLSATIAEGNRHDCVLVEKTLEAAFVDTLPAKLIADKAFDSQKLASELIEERGIELVAPRRGGKRRSRRKQDGRSLRRYKKRWKVERLFAWLKQFRRINTRWERKADNYLGFVLLGCAVILLRQL